MKFLLHVFVIMTLTYSLKAFSQNHRPIVGGTNAVKNEAPFMVSLQQGGWHYCGGTLITDEWVLTAAHCIKTGFDRIVIGLYDRNKSSNVEKHKISQIIPHPQYVNLPYDIALVRLKKKSKFKPLQLTDVEPTAGLARIYGWGNTSEEGKLSRILQTATIPIINRTRCNAVESYNGRVDHSMICAGVPQGGLDTCQGDSGGPLVYNNKLAGVVSWGQGCARPNKFGVYANVFDSLTWIKQTLSHFEIR